MRVFQNDEKGSALAARVPESVEKLDIKFENGSAPLAAVDACTPTTPALPAAVKAWPFDDCCVVLWIL